MTSAFSFTSFRRQYLCLMSASLWCSLALWNLPSTFGQDAAAAPADTPAPAEPAQPAPETPAPAPPAPVTDFAVPYARLGDPTIQAGIGLTDEQKAKVAELLTSRAETVVSAAPEARDELIAASDVQLRGILNVEQLNQFVKLVQPKIRFNFKYSRWSDVLEWFADQAGLSLVIDAPPPGTFNYRDNREYTPSEAIDKMNSWLATKDYTLIRRDSMLMVVDLSEKLPKELIPRIKPEEWAERGRYELVTTVFPLEGRVPTDVETEVKPMLGPHGESSLLPKTGQIIVTDQVKSLVSIQELIKSIPVPQPPKKEDKPKPPEPELRFYPAETFDAEAAIETMEKLVAGAKFVADPTAKRINAYATPPQHDAIAKIVEQIGADTAPEMSAALEVYPVDPANAVETVAAVQLGLPEVQVRHDVAQEQLVVFGTPDQQSKVKSILEKLGSGGVPSSNERQVEVYRLKNIERATALVLLEQVLPRVKLTSDERQNAIVAFGTLEEHEAIKSLLNQLQEEPENQSNLKTYVLKETPSTSLVTTLQELAPTAKITLEGKRLLVIADDAIQTEIEAALQQIDVPDNSLQKLDFYDIGSLDSTVVVTNLQQLLPTVRLSWDTETSKLLAFATAREHEQVQSALDEWTTNSEERPNRQIELIKLERADPTTTMTVLQGLFKQAQIMVDPGRRGLIVIADIEEQAALKAVVDQLDAEEPKKEEADFKFYPVPEKLEPNFISLLQQMTPGATITHDEPNSRIMVIAKSKDQAKAEANIGKLLAGTEEKAENVLQSYSVTSIQKQRFQALVPTLQLDFPGLQVLPETVPGELAIWARPEQHEKLTGIMEQIKSDVPLAEKQQLISYKLKVAEPTETLAVLQNLFPDTKFMMETRTRSILAWTRPALQEAIKSSLEQIDSGEPGEFQQNFVILPLKNVTFAVIQPILQEAAPAARVTHDPTANNVIIFGDEEAQNRLASILEKMQAQTKAASDESDRTTAVYPGLEGKSGGDLVKLLRQLVPGATLEDDPDAGTIIAIATEEEHQKLSETLQKLKEQSDSAEKPEAARIALKKANANDVRRLLEDALPDVEVRASRDDTAVMVVARPSQIQLIRDIIVKLDAGQIDETASLKVYSLESIPGANAGQTLMMVFPQAKYTLGTADPYKIILWGSEEEHAEYAKMIEQIDADWKPQSNASMKIYELKGIDTNMVVPVIQQAVPRATFATSNSLQRLIIWATESGHAEIAQIITQLEEQGPVGKDAEMRVYSFNATQATAVVPIIQAEITSARFGHSPDPYKMIVWATPAEHDEIKSIVDKLEAEETAVNSGEMTVYSLETVPASVAQSIIQAAHPSVRFGASPDNKKLVTWATPEQHVKIQEMVTKLDAQAGGNDFELRIYTLEATGSAYAYPIVANAVPGIVVSYSQDPSKLMVWGSPAQLAKIDKIIEQIKSDGPPAKDAYVETYTFNKIPAANAIAILQMAFPQTRITTTQDPRHLAIWARPNEHEGLAAIVEKLDSSLGDSENRAIQVFPLNNVSHITLLEFLKPDLKANANFTPNTATDNLIVQAPEDQMEGLAAAITDLVEKLPKDEKPVPKVYRFQHADPNAAIAVLRTLTPQANIAVDQRARSLVVTASPADQETIAAAVAEMDSKEASSRGNLLKHYKINNVEVSSMMGMLQTLFAFQPEVRFSMDANTSTLVAYATDPQHVEIAEFIDSLDSVGAAQTSKAYPLKNLDVNATFGIVRAMFPRNPAVPDQPTRSIVFVGSDNDHARLAEMLESIDVQGSQTNQEIKAYPVENVQPNSLVNMLQNLYRFRQDIYFSVDPQNNIIMAHAPAEYQEKIAATIAEIDQQKNTSISKAFSSSKVSGRSLYQLLLAQFRRNPEVSISLDPQGGMVMAFAPEKKMVEIEEAVAAIEASAKEIVSQVYKLDEIDARAMYQVLRGMLPDANVSFDNQSNTLMVAGSAEEQALVEKMIQQLEAEESQVVTDRVSKVYQSEKIASNSLLRVITDLFRNSRTVSVTENRESNSVVVYAKPIEHERIGEMMVALEEGTTENTIAVYRLENADPRSLQVALRSSVPDAQVGIDASNYSIVVTASETDQARVKETIAQLDMDPDEGKKLEVFNLQLNDAYTAEAAVERFFGNSIWDDNPSAPLIDSDVANQQLLVRGSDQQIKNIREFLVKMGENHLAESTSSNNKKIRVIPFEGNTQEAIEELQRIWPQLRSNRIKLVVPSAVAPTMRKFRKIHEDTPENTDPENNANFSVQDDVEAEKAELVEEAIVEPAETESVEEVITEQAAEPQPTAEELREQQEMQKLIDKARAKLKAIEEAEKAEAEEKANTPSASQDVPSQFNEPAAAPQEAAPVKPSAAVEDNQLEPAQPAPTQPEQPMPTQPGPDISVQENADNESAPPVIIAPGSDSITISSDDPEALNQIERLLRAMSRNESQPSLGKDFVIFQLKYASAESVEDTLDDLFNGNNRRRGGGARNRQTSFSPFSSITIQADERLNALIVYGNKKERDMVEELLQVLDTEESNKVLEQNQPRIVTVQNAPAVRIEAVLRDIYSSELRSAGGARPIPVPTGVSLEVATTIQQINITMAGPLLTLTVDEDTNSIIVAGADRLVNQVVDLIEQLDQKAETESTQTFRVVPLKKINSSRAREVLQELFPQNNFGSGNNSRRGRGRRGR
ncbi:Putative type II secretion system protein D precursor [Polystyrenella longa]|uniref:Type II secretion system protein D n=1 Tax=Polystyrenella longa TaxID=2528007 RepID=A0A518CPR2_9PLAN|nr:secretin N-terminal domain-containing protein [Polystyrenella longa]QDU81212.1 Putative type II secretion system protein D precursor [Polystyrenella longa]